MTPPSATGPTSYASPRLAEKRAGTETRRRVPRSTPPRRRLSCLMPCSPWGSDPRRPRGSSDPVHFRDEGNVQRPLAGVAHVARAPADLRDEGIGGAVRVPHDHVVPLAIDHL